MRETTYSKNVNVHKKKKKEKTEKDDNNLETTSNL